MKLDLVLFNSASKRKEKFIPIKENRVKMYVCGPTLYDAPHIGNARSLVVFDVLFRLLKSLYKEVIYVRNITDIDDKILNKAIANNTTFTSIVEQNLKIYNENLNYLNLLPPSIQPLATQHIDAIIELISLLLTKGYAYKKDGHIFFSVNKFNLYGSLSSRNINASSCGLGNDSIVKHIKHNPHDFVLWKPSKVSEPKWEAPFGEGRPGWHIECSAMAWKTLGKQFDIHGGGCDLIFPHHENEQAQTLAAFGTKSMAKYWVHNAFVNMNDQKMSKSLGNIVKVIDLTDKYKGEVLRMAFLLTHYRHPINFTNETLLTARSILDKMYNALRNSGVDIKNVKESSNDYVSDIIVPTKDSKFNFYKAILDDLNIPLALVGLQEIVYLLNTTSDIKEKHYYIQALKQQANILGILQSDPEEWFTTFNMSKQEIDKINHLIERRNIAKKNKNYELADLLRTELFKQGIIIEDKKHTTTWRKV